MPYINTRNTIIALVLFCVLAATGLTRLSTNANYRVYFDHDAPALKNYEALSERFGLKDSLIVYLESPADTVLSSDTALDAVLDAQDRLREIPGITGLQSFTEVLGSTGNGLIDPKVIRQLLFSDDMRHGLIILDTRLVTPGDANAILTLTQEVRNVLQSTLAPAGIQSQLSGPLALNAAYIDVVRHDLKVFFPGLLGLMLLTLMLVFRRISIALILIFEGLLAAAAAFGIAGYLGFTLAAINAFAPVMIIGLCIVTAMHPLYGVFQHLSHNLTKAESISQSFEENAKPLVLSSLTTAVGFLFLITSPSPPIRLVGITVAIGMTLSMALNLTLLPGLLNRLNLTSREASNLLRRSHRFDLKALVKSRRGTILTVTSIVILTAFSFLLSLKVDDNFYQYFPSSHSFRQATDAIDKNFAGSASISYQIDAKNGFTNAARNEYHQLLDWLKHQPDVKAVLAIPADRIDPVGFDWFRHHEPAAAQKLAQYITDTNNTLRVQVRLDQQTASAILALDERINHYIAANLTALTASAGASPDLLFAKLSITNAKNMFYSLAIALLLITLLIGLMMRSLPAMVLALTCNLVPVLIIYGFWSAAGGYISLGSAVVMGMILGIIVDDTLHILIKHQRTKDTDPGHTYLWRYILPPVLLSSLVLVIALSVGLLSDFRPIVELSFLSIAAITVACLADAVLLPALLSTPWIKQRL